MGQRAVVLGLFVIAAALAVVAAFQFNQAQEAGLRADDAATALADVQAAQATALAEAEMALAAQVAADAARATAALEAQAAATAAAEARDAQAAAVAEARTAEAGRAEIEAALAAARAQVSAAATARALDEAAQATAGAALAAGATERAALQAQLATASAALELAEFARAAAEEDRAEALLRSYTAATAQTRAERTLAALVAESTAPALTATSLAAAPTPTAVVPTAVPSATVTAQTRLTFTLRDGSLAVQYPPDWLVQEYEGQIFMVNNPSVLDNPSSDLRPGQFLVNILVLSASQFSGLEREADALAFLTALTEVVNSRGQSGIRLSQPTALEVGSYSAARAEGQSAVTQTVVVALALGQGNFAVAFGNCVPGELELYEPALRDVLASLVYRPPAR